MKSKLSLLICLCMLVSLFSGISLGAMAEETADVIIIKNQADLEAIDDSTEALAKSYKLGNNIILNSSYVSIADFAGSFDGDGKTVLLNGTTNGIFASTTKTAEVFNVSVVGTVNATNANIGGIVGWNKGIIHDCINYATINAASSKQCTAGISGGANDSSDANGTKNSVIYNCVNFGTINGAGGFIGGIMGITYGKIYNCANYGTVKSISGGSNVGGITGHYNNSKAAVDSCYNFGNVSASSSVGGIIGYTAGSNTVTNCYNAGKINSNTNSATESLKVAGIIGYVASGNEKYNNLYNVGTIVGKEDLSNDNAIYGVLNTGKVAPTVSGLYYLGDDSETKKDGTVALSETDMTTEGKFVGFDFNNTWTMGTGNYLYPILKDFEYTGEKLTNIFPISSAEEFIQIVNAPEADYILTDDITLPDSYEPIAFSGEFDGNGKTITVSIDKGTAATDDGSSNGAALFSYVYGSDVVIKNLTVDGFVKGYNAVAGIVGAIGKLDSTYTVVDTAITGAVTIENCVNKATLTSGRYPVGGIVGDAYVGTGGKPVIVKGCSNFGTIEAGYTRRGGIAGLTNSTVTITECSNFGTIKGTGDVGGIVGMSYGSITKCMNAGNVSVAGIAGAFSGSGDVSDLFNIGTVGTAGIAGEDMTGRTYTNCYSTYKLTDDANAILQSKKVATAEKPAYTSFSNCYYLSDAETSSVEGTTPLTADEMKVQDNFKGFDFENTWEFVSGLSTPKLQAVKLEELGTDAFPYLIKTADDYNKLNNKTGKYILVNDISLTDHTPVADFAGEFDGNGKTVTINSANGLFASTKTSALIKNVTIAGIITNTTDMTGAVVGVNNGIVEGCTNNATVKGVSYTGGIVGYLVKGSVRDCVNTNAISGTQRIGGIAGQSTAGTTVSNCVNSGSISGSSSYQGGIVGVNMGQLLYSVNAGHIKGSGNGHIGGIAGLHQGNKPLEFCYNVGTVEGAGVGGSGGIAGSTMTNVLVENCYNIGEVSSSHAYAVGGIVGVGNKYGMDINKTYNVGTVTAANIDVTSEHGIYGFDGDTELNSGASIDITNSYYLGTTVEGAKGVAKTSFELSAQTTFADWDFENVWEFGTKGYTYPILTNIEFLVEEGTELNPYVIKTQADFEKISEEPEAYYTLANDITLDSTYEPFAFAGKLEGNNKKIAVAIDKGSETGGTSNYTGIFTYIYGDAPYVKNLTITGSVSGYDKVGALAGALGVSGTATITGEVLLENITNEAAVTAHNQTGGILGDAYYGVSDTKTTVIITGCVNKGVITGNNYTGGVVGLTRKTVSVEYAANTSNITGGAYTGGIVGGAYGSVNKAYNFGDVKGNPAGGIIGQTTTTLPCADLFNTGTISGNTSGGILGLDTYGETVYTNCYNIGATKEDCEIFGAKSNIMKDGTVNTPKAANCYYLSDEETPSWEGTIPLTLDEMKVQTNYAGFDFENVWKLNSSEFMFPTLKNLYFNVEAGSKYAPIEIGSASEFMALEGKTEYYILTEDIDLSTVEYAPIAFSGKLDGNGHTITVALNTKDLNNVGIFSELSGSIEIKNLKLAGTINAVNEAPSKVSLKGLGALAGNIASDTTGKIADIESSVAITYNQYDSVGGFVGNAYATGVAVEFMGLINNGSITLTTNSSNNVGGIVGLTFALSSVSDCINNADIVTANVAGGIVGSSYCNITNSYNNGDIFAEDIVGGIAANVAGSPSITNCYNTGDLISSKLIDESLIRIGGIVGYDASGNANITNCYNIGAVVRENENYMNISGISGDYNSKKQPTVITNSYYLSDGEEEAAKTKAELEDLAEILGEAFETSTSANYTFPQLKGLTNDVTISMVKISVADAINGKVISDKEYAKVGSDVTITATPDEGYLTTSVKAGDAELETADGKAIFTANSDITVSAIFTEDTSVPSAPVAKKAYTGVINAENLVGNTVDKQLTLIGKNAILAFATVSKGNSAHVLKDYGFVVSSAIETPVIGEAMCYQVSSYNENKLQSGALIYGAPVDSAKDYTWFVVPYAVYETSEGDVTLYGSAVEIMPSVIAQ